MEEYRKVEQIIHYPNTHYFVYFLLVHFWGEEEQIDTTCS